MQTQRIRLLTHGGVHDLGRVVNVLALLDLTPLSFSATPRGEGMEVEACIRSDQRTAALCIGRLQAFAAISHAWLTPLGEAAA